MVHRVKQRLVNRQHPLLLRLEWLELDAPLLKAIEEGATIKAIYDELPLQQVLLLGVLADEYPGLRWHLRKERDRYTLSILSNMEENNIERRVK